ncbi:MAG: DUF853 family protein [Deltaproteobacteria bacterium]|nr:DUF853 family protein [Deltaproteobacteria bacterium]
MSNPELALPIAKAGDEISLLASMANRHGLIAGATGTGKTVTLRVLAEQFSSAGVPVFMADIKGDLSGLPIAGGDHPKVIERVQKLGFSNFQFQGFPVVFWDVFGEQGHPVRTTVSDMGPLLLARIMDLNETQNAVLTMVFKIADDSGMLLLDLKDLRAMVQFVGDNAEQYRVQYGNVSRASIGAIQRGLLAIEQEGGGRLFGEPALNIQDLIQTGHGGKGVINIMVADKLMQSPKIYATMLLWMLSELFEQLPEVGDREKPTMIFFFDEAHLLFDDAPKALQNKIEQVVRLIRSKGVGIFFVTQNPLDLPEDVLGQLGNRVQHALRAFTPKDQKAVKSAAETFRSKPGLNVVNVITELGVGEALVSVLDSSGTPTRVERALIYPPKSRMKPLSPSERSQVISASDLYGYYEKVVDRESAYEKLKVRSEQKALEEQAASASKVKRSSERSETATLLGAAAKSAAHAIGSQVGRQIIRGVLGSIFGGGRKR